MFHLTKQGLYQEKPKLPFVPGGELSGTVLEVGEGVSHVRPGDRVVCASLAGGAFAEKCLVPAAGCFPLPRTTDLVAAAGLPVAFGTSHVALCARAGLRKGQTVLVLGAAGGVGAAAVQIARVVGASVLAVASCSGRPGKAELLRELGADHVLDAAAPGFDLRKSVLAIVPKGVDVVYDPVGGKSFTEALRCVTWGAQLLTIGYAEGDIPKVPLNILLVKNLTLHGVYWGSYMVHRPSILVESMRELVGWLAEGRIRVPVSHRVTLARAGEAFEALATRQVQGKAVLVCDASSTARL